MANISRQQEASKAGITADEVLHLLDYQFFLHHNSQVRQIVRGEVVGALRDSSPRQHSTPKPDFKLATMRQNIQVPENHFFVSCFAVANVDICFHQSHIQAGRIEAAFQAALSASDLQMVNCFTFTTHHQHQVKVTNYMLILKTSNFSFFSQVVFTCELLNTTQVFNSATCPLSQVCLHT